MNFSERKLGLLAESQFTFWSEIEYHDVTYSAVEISYLPYSTHEVTNPVTRGGGVHQAPLPGDDEMPGLAVAMASGCNVGQSTFQTIHDVTATPLKLA